MPNTSEDNSLLRCKINLIEQVDRDPVVRLLQHISVSQAIARITAAVLPGDSK